MSFNNWFLGWPFSLRRASLFTGLHDLKDLQNVVSISSCCLEITAGYIPSELLLFAIPFAMWFTYLLTHSLRGSQIVFVHTGHSLYRFAQFCPPIRFAVHFTNLSSGTNLFVHPAGSLFRPSSPILPFP